MHRRGSRKIQQLFFGLLCRCPDVQIQAILIAFNGFLRVKLLRIEALTGEVRLRSLCRKCFRRTNTVPWRFRLRTLPAQLADRRLCVRNALKNQSFLIRGETALKLSLAYVNNRLHILLPDYALSCASKPLMTSVGIIPPANAIIVRSGMPFIISIIALPMPMLSAAAAASPPPPSGDCAII